MNAEDIVTIIDEDLKYYNSIMINGTWGIGKTHYLNEALKNKKGIYIRLFGKESINEIKAEVQHCFSNKIFSTAHTLYDFTQKTIALGIGVVSINLPERGSSLNFKKLKKKINKKAEKDKEEILIVFDDLERKSSKIAIESLLGYIEELSQLDNTKIIVVANEEEFLKSDSDDTLYLLKPNEKYLYEKFKEKVIQKTFNIKEYAKNAPSEIFDFEKMCSVSNHIKKTDFDILLFSFIEKHHSKNLRTLQKAIPFLNELFDKIDFTELKAEDIADIIIIALSIVVESTENLYIEQAHKDEEDIKFMEDVYNPIEARVLRYYLNTDVHMSSKRDLVNFVSNIFNDCQKDDSFSGIQKYYQEVYSIDSDENIDLFYRSQEDTKLYINEIIATSITQFNPNINIESFFKKIDTILEYSQVFPKEIILDKEDVHKRLDDYAKNRDKTLSIWEATDFFGVHFCKNTVINEYIGYFRKSVTREYYIDLFTNLKIEYDNGKYDCDVLKLLESYFFTTDISDVETYNFIKENLSSNEYFIPDLNDKISAESWRWTHIMFKIIGSCNPIFSEISINFSDYIKDKLKSAGNLGKYRINSLIEQYHINLGENEKKQPK